MTGLGADKGWLWRVAEQDCVSRCEPWSSARRCGVARVGKLALRLLALIRRRDRARKLTVKVRRQHESAAAMDLSAKALETIDKNRKAHGG